VQYLQIQDSILKRNSPKNGDESKLLTWVGELNGLSVQEASWAYLVEIPAFPNPVGYILTSFGFSSLL
jgi:hypothetical protein